MRVSKPFANSVVRSATSLSSSTGKTSGMPVQFYASFENLPKAYDMLFAIGAKRSFCLSRTWFESLAEAILESGERLSLVGHESDCADRKPLALLVGRHRDRDPELNSARAFTALANYYTMDYAPLMVSGSERVHALQSILKALRSGKPAYDAIRFQPLDRDHTDFETLAAAMKQAGWFTRPYFHFGNWYQSVEGLSYADYFAERPGALRNTLARKGATLCRSGEACFELVSDSDEVERGIATYHAIYERSWKSPEPYPQVITDLMRSSAAQGALRLGILSLNDQPVAAQIWIVWQGRATLYKLAHDQAFDHLSLGTLLTARLLEHVIDQDRVTEVDFGAGDDPFKKDWMPKRRERWGLIGYDPRTLKGARGALYQWAGDRLGAKKHSRELLRTQSQDRSALTSNSED